MKVQGPAWAPQSCIRLKRNDILSLKPFRTFCYFEFHLLAFGQSFEAVSNDCTEPVHTLETTELSAVFSSLRGIKHCRLSKEAACDVFNLLAGSNR